MLMFCALLATPAYAVTRFVAPGDLLLMSGLVLTISTFTLLVYRSDKRRAEAGDWRIPESTLHLAALLGGWPGAFLAQRLYRHKTAKASFQFVFWTIVLLHQFAAYDSLTGWRLSKEAYRFVQTRS